MGRSRWNSLKTVACSHVPNFNQLVVSLAINTSPCMAQTAPMQPISQPITARIFNQAYRYQYSSLDEVEVEEVSVPIGFDCAGNYASIEAAKLSTQRTTDRRSLG